jgi:uncharacterized membrane protein YphA (DoxX/SURF4 family)
VKPLTIVKIILRLALAAIFIYSAYAKLKDPWYVFASSIDAYRILPSAATVWIAKVLPWFELVLGALLVIGFKARWVAIICGLLLAGFWGSMLRAHLLGMDIDCGCFGPGEKVSNLTLLRDSLMIVLAGVVWWMARKPGQTSTKNETQLGSANV